jgi:hypothetical protein
MLMKEVDPEHYQATLDHLVTMARMPAFKRHAWHRVKELEADPYAFYAGLKEDFLAIMQVDKPTENA